MSRHQELNRENHLPSICPISKCASQYSQLIVFQFSHAATQSESIVYSSNTILVNSINQDAIN